MRFDERHWYHASLTWATALLLPASWLFGWVTAIRRWCYQSKLFSSHRFQVPVIIVGNLTVGGTGKTPCVIALANYFLSQGFQPGIVSRGYGGSKKTTPQLVTLSSSASEVGDEAVLLARHSQCPVVVGADRVAAVKALLRRNPHCNMVISDDGLQHYQLARDVEIVVVDGDRQFGNGCLLPAGPLREPLSRLQSINFVIVNGGVMDNAFSMILQSQRWVSLNDPQTTLPTDKFVGTRVHAVAGIGHPARFFNLLKTFGYQIIEHAFPDHHPYLASDLNFPDELPIVMTSKDAVKCETFANERMWYLDIKAVLEPELLSKLTDQVQGA